MKVCCCIVKKYLFWGVINYADTSPSSGQKKGGLGWNGGGWGGPDTDIQ